MFDQHKMMRKYGEYLNFKNYGSEGHVTMNPVENIQNTSPHFKHTYLIILGHISLTVIRVFKFLNINYIFQSPLLFILSFLPALVGDFSGDLVPQQAWPP